jgi:hypothetical protein
MRYFTARSAVSRETSASISDQMAAFPSVTSNPLQVSAIMAKRRVASFFLIRAHSPSLQAGLFGNKAPVKDRFRGDAKGEKA